MRLLQLTSETRLVAADGREREEAVLELVREKRPVVQVLGRLPLRVQQALDALDDLRAMGQEQLQKLDMRLKRHLAGTIVAHNPYPSDRRPIVPEANLAEQGRGYGPKYGFATRVSDCSTDLVCAHKRMQKC